jgi:hypothetical protein
MNRRLAAECFFVSPHFGNTHVSRSLLALLCYCLLNKACRYLRVQMKFSYIILKVEKTLKPPFPGIVISNYLQLAR